MRALLTEISTAIAIALLVWAGIALLTNESVVDDWLVSVAQRSADSRGAQAAGTEDAADVGVILIDDDALRTALADSNARNEDDSIAKAHRSIAARLLEVVQSDGRARAVMLDLYASPYTKVAASVPVRTNCRLPVVQIALPPPSSFGQEFVRPDPDFLGPASPCSVLAYSFANQAAEGEKLRTIDHNPVRHASGCPVLSLSVSAFALSDRTARSANKLSGSECQRQQAISELCRKQTVCRRALQGRMPLTAPPEDLSVRLANDFFDPAIAQDAREWLGGRLVFIGSSSTRSEDFFYLADGSLGDALGLTAEPTGDRWPGVILHAGLTQRMLQAAQSGSATIRFLGWPLSLLMGLAVAALAALAFRRRLGPFDLRRAARWFILSMTMLLLLTIFLAGFGAVIVHSVIALFGLAVVGAGIALKYGGKRARKSD